jgi:hypothetical protein
MPFAGKQLMARDIAVLAAPHWPNQKIKAVSVALAESAGYVGATHENDNGTIDLGLYQINETQEEAATSDLTTNVQANIDAAYKLFEQPWIRNGEHDIRKWQPWVSYTSGWATFPDAWIWHQDLNGNPIGPWIKTGRYVHKAIAGVANAHLLVWKDMSLDQALKFAQAQATIFGVTDGSVPIRYVHNGVAIVSWKYAPAPLKTPTGTGPRPVPNNGA